MNYGLCYVCDEYPPVVDAFGGMGVAFREQAETFARLGRRVDVICRTTHRAPGIHCSNGVRVHVVKPAATPKARALVDRFRLGSLIQRICTRPSDIVISAEYAGPFIVKSFSNPLVVQLEGSMTVSAIEQQLPAGRLAKFFERRTVNLADAVAAVSRFGGDVTLSTLGARPRDVRVFPNSVNAALFHPVPAEVDPHRILFVGKMNRLKGLYVLAEGRSRGRRALQPRSVHGCTRCADARAGTRARPVVACRCGARSAAMRGDGAAVVYGDVSGGGAGGDELRAAGGGFRSGRHPGNRAAPAHGHPRGSGSAKHVR
jgi:hypothetical protein